MNSLSGRGEIMTIRPLMFFDVEVYLNLYFAVFMDEQDTIEVWAYEDDLPEYLFTDYQLVGFNSNSYDDAILDNWGLEPSKMRHLSDLLIQGDKNIRYRRYSFDVLRQLKNDPTVGVGCPGLKEIDFNLGNLPVQSPVPFDKPVPADKIQEVIDYCTNDVKVLRDIFNNKRTFFDSLFHLHDNYGFKLTKTSASNIDDLFQHTHKPVVDLDSMRKALNKVLQEILIYDTIAVVSGEGGVHGAEPSCMYENVINLDVASQYPSIIINLGLLGEKTDLFKRMRDERLKIKKSDPIASGGLKIVLNTCYGVLNGDQGYFKMEHKDAGVMVCLYGQYSICSLMLELLKHGATIIQINTDGVMFTGLENQDLDNIIQDWQLKFNMTLELDSISKVIQKDVNNYVAVFENGYVKTKGGDLGNALGRRSYKKNTSIVIEKMIYNLLLDRPIEKDIVHYDYARFLRPTEKYPTIRMGAQYLTEGVVVLPWEVENGFEIVKVKPTGEESRFTNITYCQPYCRDFPIPWDVRAGYIRTALEKVYGRYRKDGQPYSNSNSWVKDKNKKDFYEELLDL